MLFVKDTIETSEKDRLDASTALDWFGLIVNFCSILIDETSHLTALGLNLFVLTASKPPPSIIVNIVVMTVDSSHKVVARTEEQDWSLILSEKCHAIAFFGLCRKSATSDFEEAIMLWVPILTLQPSYCLVSWASGV